ncbi:four-jointed box protein 1 [Gadus chalcogrammus]|uniref:four-jointed box protein 1 n=1 Tax=Gadus chalcogrammus TaxID=1042646 RepID=UPI0024C49AD5|nr:four-jointed box protein 1 [Gadus chalcogrammus]
MKIVLANLFALLFLCTCLSVLYVWTTLESRLDRHKRSTFPGPAVDHPRSLRSGGPSTDPSPKTFRALLAVPAAERLQRPAGVYNLSASTGSPDPRMSYHGDNEGGSARRARGGEDRADRFDPNPVEDGIFWSQRLEEKLSAGFTEEHARAWRARARAQRVVRLEPGCGRISNQLATFSDGTRACVRYGINADQVQGETLTSCLATLLGIANLPPLALSQLSGTGAGAAGGGEQWAAVRRRVEGLQWSERAVVSLTEWVANLTGVVTPSLLRQEGGDGGGVGGGLHPFRQELRNKTRAELFELMQWSDLILMDYLTANFDRLVSNLFSLQWDPRVMERDTNNLLRAPRGDLLFIDNEAGLVHGYRVLGMWEKYHDTVLGSVCVFRRRTARRVAEMSARQDARARLLELYRDTEPLAPVLGFLSDEHAGLLQARIDTVHRHISHCREKYGRL